MRRRGAGVHWRETEPLVTPKHRTGTLASRQRGQPLTDSPIDLTTGTKVPQMSMIQLTNGKEPPCPHEWGLRETDRRVQMVATE